MGILSISVVDFLANLLGESKFDSLASRSSKLSDALLRALSRVLNFWDGDAFLFGEVLTADSWERDRLVDTGLDGFRIDNLNSGLNRGDDRNIVASLLGNFLAVIVSVAVISVSWGWLADCDHLGVTLLLECNFNCLGIGGFSLLLVGVSTDFIVNLLNAFSADSAGDWVTLFSVNDDLDGKFDWVANSLKGWGADLSSFNNILN